MQLNKLQFLKYFEKFSHLIDSNLLRPSKVLRKTPSFYQKYNICENIH